MGLNALVNRLSVGGAGVGAAWPVALSVLHALAIVLLAIVLFAWCRHGRRRAVVTAGLLTVLAVTLTYLIAVQAEDIPTEWVTILHHGLGRKAIMHLYGRGAHVGENFVFVLSVAAGWHWPTLHNVVWLNLLLALVNATIFLFVAGYVAGPAWMLPWTLVFALNPAMFLAAFSELPTNLLGLYFLLGVIAWAVVTDPLPQARGARAAAYGLVAVLTILAALTRPEVAILGIVALAVEAAYYFLGEDSWSAAWHRLGQSCARVIAFLDDHPTVVILLSLAGVWFAIGGLPWGLAGRSETSALYPFNPSILALFFYLPMLALPIGASVATAFGFVRATLQFRNFAGLALSLLILVRMYFAGEYHYYEMGRYLSYVMPAIFLLGLFGKRELDTIVNRYWQPTWRRVVRVGYLMAWFTLPLPGIVAFYTRPEYDPGGGFAQILLDLDNQREVRHLMSLTENNPDCVFIGRVIEDHRGDPKVETRYAHVVFGKPIPQPVVVPEGDMLVEEIVRRYAGGASCVRLYYGGDCNLTFADRCTSFVDGHRLLGEYRFWSRPYNNPLQSGHTGAEVVLATYAWP